MECDLKGLLKSTVEETKLKEKYTIFSIWKKSFRHLYYQFQFQFQSVLFRLRLKTLWFKPPNENSFETVLNYLFHWLFNARRTLTWFAVTLSQDSIKELIQQQAVNRLLSLKCNSPLPQSSNGLSSVCRMQKTIKLPRFLYNG